ncbi:MAG TPA: HAMP domain-containing sensor histidine kinase [Erysipelotrichaceae bacterium]|nr:HAMP domain-containing histidine kinase [Erysipelotrichia bacterium]HPX32342.1 HAMP domain-containing sensor histidine kinase [Erysipelotrichaceae bacterium]HQA84853.1 HAMP domain-containing sensor histidine kinase [Erysipelotrichaceae bacterium]
MRRFLKSITDVSLFQQVSLIIVTFGVVLIFFFSVYLRGNIDDFVINQVMSLLHRSQESLVKTLNEDSGFSDLAYDADVIHFVYSENKCIKYYGGRVTDEFISKVNEIALENDSGWKESSFEANDKKYFYYYSNTEGKFEVISIIGEAYGNAIENDLLSNVSNTSAIVFSVIFILLTIWVATIITPLLQMQSYIEKIRQGEDNVVLNIERKDELGDLAKALVDMHSEIKRQEETKEEIIQNISHDLKTPIATIKSYAESIKDGVYPYDTLEKSVDVIVENADRLERKVYSLLFLNRLDYMMEQEKETDKTTDMYKLINEVLVSFKMIRPELKIDLQLSPAVFKGDKESWLVVISNLLDNALRYAENKINIVLEPYYFSIANDGPSLSTERVKTLFKPFEKGDKGKFGLGLSICYKVCNAYDYSIVAENLEKGVIFRVEAKNKPKQEKRKADKS